MPLERLDALLHHLLRRAGTRRGGDLADSALLERFARTRDEDAFAALVERHGPLVYDVCRRVLRRPQDAEDAFQATFLVLARRAADLRRASSLASWLHTVAFRIALRARADAARRPLEYGRALDMLPAEPRAAEVWRDLRPVLDEELQRLPEKYRVPVVLCYLEGRTHAEAARQLGWPLGTVAGRLARARALLRDRLTGRGITLSAGLLGTVLAEHALAKTLPAGLAKTTVRGAAAFAAASTVGISAKVAALAEGGLQALFTAKWKLSALLVAAMVLTMAGAGVGAWHALHEEPTAEARADTGPRPWKEEAAQVRLDRYGDPLPPGVLMRLGSLRLRGKGEFSPDGKTLALIAPGGETVSLLDRATAREVRRLEHAPGWETPGVPGWTRRVSSVVFSPDGNTLVTGEIDTLCFWDVATGKELRQIKGELHTFRILFAPDGKTLVTVRIGQGLTPPDCRVWDLATGKQRWHSVCYVSKYTSDSKTLIGFKSRPGSRAILFLDVATGKEIRQHTLPWRHPLEIAPDGKTVAQTAEADGDKVIHLHDFASGQTVRQFQGHQERIATIAFSADGKTLASMSEDQTLRLWDMATGKELSRFAIGMDYRRSLQFAPDGRVLALTNGSELRCLDAQTGRNLHRFGGARSPMISLAFFPDGKTLVATSYEEPPRFWDVTSGEERQRFHIDGNAHVLAISPDGTRLATGNALAVALWDTANGNEVRRWPGHEGGTTRLLFSPAGTLLASDGNDNRAHLRDVATGKELHPWKDVRPGAFSPDGTLLVSSAQRTLRLWDVTTGKERPWPGEGLRTSDQVVFSPDGKLVIARVPTADPMENEKDRQPFALWELASGKERVRLAGSGSAAGWDWAFSPDGRIVVERSHLPQTRLWDVASGAELPSLKGHATTIGTLAFSPDGRLLATGSFDTTVLIWDATHLLPKDRRETRKLAPAERERFWTDLAATDATQAHQAIWALVRAEQSVSFLKTRVQPVAAPDPRRLAQLVADLNSERFAVREQATAELEAFAELAGPALRKALAGQPNPELRRRAERLLQEMEWVKSAEPLRALRAVEVLKHVGTSEAREALKTLATGVAEARLTRAAKEALR